MNCGLSTEIGRWKGPVIWPGYWGRRRSGTAAAAGPGRGMEIAAVSVDAGG